MRACVCELLRQQRTESIVDTDRPQTGLLNDLARGHVARAFDAVVAAGWALATGAK